MIKRILAGAAAAGFAVSLLGASPASAACSAPTESSHTGHTAVANPATGGKIYYKVSPTDGYLGTSGTSGWIEATGGTGGGHISGRGGGAASAVYGYIGGSTGGTPTICVAGNP